MSGRKLIALTLLLPSLVGISIALAVSSVWPFLFSAALTFGFLFGLRLNKTALIALKRKPDVLSNQLAEELKKKSKILAFIAGMQSEFMKKDLSSGFFDEMLDFLMDSTCSEYGFIGEILYQENGAPYLKTHAITDISWDEHTRTFYEQNISSGLEFYNLDTLFGVAITSGQAVLANDPKNDDRAAGIPAGHPPLNAFLGVPIYSADSKVGLIGLANRPGGYDQKLLEELAPVVSALGTAIEAIRVHKRRYALKEELQQQRNRLELLYQVTIQATLSFEEQIEKSLQIVSQELGLGTGIVSRINGDDYLVQHVYSSNLQISPGTRLELGTTYCSLVMNVAEVVAIDEVGSSQYREHPCYKSFSLESYIGCPLFIGGVVVGTICFSSSRRREKSFSESEKDFVRLAAHFISASMERKNAREKLEETVAELEVSNISLTKAHRIAEQAAHAKSAFLAMMSHEIRTPITAIMGLSEILAHEEQVAPFDAKQASQTIYTNSRYLLDVINNILDYSKMESGNLEVERIDCSLFEILGDLEALVNLKAVEKDLLLLIDYEYPLPRKINTDPTRLKQVLVNLVSNAIKFTEKGSVRVQCRFDQIRHSLELSVIDTGIGISQEGLQNLYQPFKQADLSINRRFGGTGLGMSIAHEIIKKLGGEISVQSTPGIGTTFRVCLPDVRSADNQLLHENPLLLEKSKVLPNRKFSGRVLVVEDERVNQKLFAHVLSRAGLEVEIAEDGQSAVEKAMTDSFDLILMDLHLPVLDGPTATSMLRQKGLSVPIVALTASQDLGDIERCLHAGCVEYLPKPFHKEQLFDCLDRYIGTSEGLQIESVSDGPPALPDDQRFMQLVLGYSRKLPGRLKDIEDYAARQEWKALREAAHIMAGAGIFGFNKVAFVAKLLEEKAQSKNQKACAELLGRLREEVGKVSDLKKDK